MHKSYSEASILHTCLWLGVMLSIILLKGLLAFYVVSDKGQPTWDYRSVRDVPASSPYAVYQLLPNQQHVKGAKGE